MKVAVLGHGTIGKSLCAALEESKEHELKWILELPQFATEPKMTSELDDILNDPEVELVCDVLPGIHPSYEYVKKALAAGKHVVSANKAALGFGFKEMVDLAEAKGVALRYEAACGGTIPDITEAFAMARTNEITSIYGIMNGTTNFIIDKMDRDNAEFEPTLKEAQALGYAEADPTADLSGFDVKNKIFIISCTAYGGYVVNDFPMSGIEKLTGDILKSFKAKGQLIKLFGISVRKGDEYAIGVVPTVVSGDSLEAHVPKNFNMFTIIGDKAGEVKIYGQGAGGAPTADAIMRDINAVADGNILPGKGYFARNLKYNPALLSGKGYINGKVVTGTLEELVAAAKAEDAFLAFCPI